MVLQGKCTGALRPEAAALSGKTVPQGSRGRLHSRKVLAEFASGLSVLFKKDPGKWQLIGR